MLTTDSLETTTTPIPLHYQRDFYIGLGLAILSGVFIGISNIVKKKALIKISEYATSAGDGGYAYLKEWMWWAAILILGVGELCNCFAYSFAPATLVTPLGGALNVILVAVLSSYFLNEALNCLGKIGCVLCILGSFLLPFCAPAEDSASTVEELQGKVLDPIFIVYVAVVIITTFLMITCVAPRYGNTNILVYIVICSLMGSLVVMCSKGVGIGLRSIFAGIGQPFRLALMWIMIVSLVVFTCLQMHYLNKALDIYNTSVVTPIYYFFFTTTVLVASVILFKEWKLMSFLGIVGTLAGFGTIVAGIFLLTAFRDINSISDLPSLSRIFRLNTSQDSPYEQFWSEEESSHVLTI